MFYGVGLSVILGLLWLTLSGYYTLSGDYPLVIMLGILSILISVGMAVRMRILDRETVPIVRGPSLFAYWGWLGGQILAANIAVLKLIMRPDVDIEPRLVRVPVDLRSGTARCVYANSITLTPGTVTVDVEDDGYLVHALDKSLTDPDGFAEMALRADLASDGRRDAGDVSTNGESS
jgi:multicomponent Na+:H+ antiporter subunit E